MRRPLAALALTALAGCGSAGERADGTRNMSRQEVAHEQAQVRIAPGEWELATEITGVEAPAMPRELMQAMQGRRTSGRHCITPEQAGDPAMFSRDVQQGDCQVQGFTMRGGRMAGQTICGAGTGREVRSQMNGRYGPDSFDYETRVATPAPIAGGTMNLAVRVHGRRIGECREQRQRAG